MASDVEHDPVHLLLAGSDDLPDPLPTSAVNYAIRVFAQTFAHQSSSIQQGALEQISIYFAGAVGQQNAAKEQAVTINIVLALLLALQHIHDSRSTASISSTRVQTALQELLNVSFHVRRSSQPYY